MNFSDPISANQIRDWRREIHKVPEPGWAEFVSNARVMAHMQKCGLKVLSGTDVIDTNFVLGARDSEVQEGIKRARNHGVSEELLSRMQGLTGCVGVFDSGRAGPTIAFRFELDCVPVNESTDPEHIPAACGFASTVPGYMHACGHDGHQAVGMALASWIGANKDKLCGKIKLIYEPGEEGGRGALPIAKRGIVDDVDYIIAAHIGCDIPAGTVITAPEKFLCSRKIDFFFKGSASHSAMQPEVGRNALLAATTATNALFALPRHSEGSTRVNVGVLRAGEGRNVIASNAEMQVEVRGENDKITQKMFDEAMMRVEGAAAMFGCSVSHRIMGNTIDFEADRDFSAELGEIAKKAPLVENVKEYMNFNGSDDATILLRTVQEHGGKAAYLVVGSKLAGGHHQARYDFEEERLYSMYVIERDFLISKLAK